MSNPLQATRSHNATVRGDVRLTDKDSLFLRYSLDNGVFSRLPVLPVRQTGVDRDIPARSWGVGYTRIISPSLINELRFAYNYIGAVQDATLPLDPIIPNSLDARVKSSIPTFAVTGYPTLGDQPANYGNNPVPKSQKFGTSRTTFRGCGTSTPLRPALTFNTSIFRRSLHYRAVATGASLASLRRIRRPAGHRISVADLLLGYPNPITIGSPSDANERARNYYFYVQDDWTVTSKLTLNFGVRYELTAPFYDANNRLANLVTDPGSLYNQYVIAGDPRLPRSLQELDKNNIAPRVGFAYRAGRGLVIRGGGGIFFAQDEGFGISPSAVDE